MGSGTNIILIYSKTTEFLNYTIELKEFVYMYFWKNMSTKICT